MCSPSFMTNSESEGLKVRTGVRPWQCYATVLATNREFCCKEFLGSIANKKPLGLPCIRSVTIASERGGTVQFPSAVTRYTLGIYNRLTVGFDPDFSTSTPANVIHKPSAVSAGVPIITSSVFGITYTASSTVLPSTEMLHNTGP